MRTKGERRLGRRELVLGASLVLSLLLCELALRLVLFHDVPALSGLARELRQPGFYADSRREDLYWELQRIWTAPGQRKPFGRLAQRTGWTSPRIDPVTLVSQDEVLVGERRPVLVYGGSFAACVTPPEEAWQGLLERSPEGPTHAIVNYAVSGFGPDQALSMLEATIERFAGRNPLVVLGICLDEDTDRVLLGFRGMPKPRCELAGGELVFRPLAEHDAQAWWDAHPPGVASYLWRLLRGPAGPLPDAWQRSLGSAPGDAQVVALNRAILARLHARLEALHVEHFVLGFHGRVLLEDPQHEPWREEFVRAACRELRMHFLSSRPYALAAVGGRTELLARTLFTLEGPLTGHLNARGNAVVFEAFRQALRGRYEPEDVSGVDAAMRRMGLHPDRATDLELAVLGRPAELHFHGPDASFALREIAGQEARSHVLALFPSREHPALLEWPLASGARFRAQALAVPAGGPDPSAEAVRLTLLVDGAERSTLELRPGAQPVAIEQPLRTPCTLALRVEPLAGHPNSCWARLSETAIE
jgi:hypothetical protein